MSELAFNPGRPHRCRLKAKDPAKRIVKHEHRAKVGKAEKIDHSYVLEQAKPWGHLPLSEDQAETAKKLCDLWETAALSTRSVTMNYDRCGGGDGEMSERRAWDHARLNRALRAMGQWRTAEVIGAVVYGEPRRIDLVREGLDMAEREL